MMGRLNHDQEQFFYSFRLDEAVPNDHPVREVASVLTTKAAPISSTDHGGGKRRSGINQSLEFKMRSQKNMVKSFPIRRDECFGDAFVSRLSHSPSITSAR